MSDPKTPAPVTKPENENLGGAAAAASSPLVSPATPVMPPPDKPVPVADRLDAIEERLAMDGHTPNHPADITPPVGSMDLLPPAVKAEDDKCSCEAAHRGSYDPKCPMHGEAREKEIAAQMAARAAPPAPAPTQPRAPGDK